MTKPNDPISPDPMRGADQSIHNQTPEKEPTGLTKLEYFAGLAMQGLLQSDRLADAERFNGEANGFARHCIAAASVSMAKSLIEELNKENQ